MKRPRSKSAANVRHRALEIVAAHPNGCTEAMLVADNIPADVLIALVQSGLVTARVERVDEEDGFLEVTTLRITAAGGGAGGAGVTVRRQEHPEASPRPLGGSALGPSPDQPGSATLLAMNLFFLDGGSLRRHCKSARSGFKHF